MAVCQETPEQIGSSVQSVLQQSFTDFECIIVLDNPENTQARTTLERLAKQDKRITLHYHTHNQGLGVALNTAIEHARGEFFVRMDADDKSLPGRFAKQVAYMHNNKDTDLLFTWWREIDEIGNIIERKPPTEHYKNIHKYFFITSVLSHPTMMVRRNVLEDHPYPNVRRPEDLPLFMELIRLGYTFGVLEEVLYEYKVDRQNIRARWQKIRTYSWNMLWHLMREIPHYWSNPYFWIYVWRMKMEFLVSRSFVIFRFVHARLARIWKRVLKI